MSGDSIAISITISDRWLGRVRTAWYVVAALSLFITIAAIPGYIQAVPEGFSVIPFALNPSPVVWVINALSALFSLATVLLSLSLAFLLFRRRPNDRMALFLSFYLLAFGPLTGPLEIMGRYINPSFTIFVWQVNVFLFQAILFTATSFLFVLFPDGRFAPVWSRRVAMASLITSPVMVISFLIWFRTDPRPLAALVIASIPPVVVMVGVLYAQFYRYRHLASGQQKQQIKWVVYGLGILLFIQAASSIPYFWSFTLPPDTPYPSWLAFLQALYFLSFTALPISLTIAVMRYRLYDIDILINRTLVYGGLSLLIVALYVLTIVGVGAAFQRSSNLVSLFLATLLAIPLIRPVHRFLQRGADRLVPIGADLPLQRSTSDALLSDHRKEKTISDDASATISTSWSPRRRSAVRAAWYVSLILALVIAIIATARYTQVFILEHSIANASPVEVAINVLAGLLSLATMLLSLSLAFQLFHRRPEERMAIFLSFYLLAFSVLSGPLGQLGPVLPSSIIIFAWGVFIPLIMYPASCFLFLLFPDGHFAPGWARWVGRASLVIAPASAIAFLTGFRSKSPNFSTAIGSILLLGGMFAVVYAQFYRYRHIATRQQKQQIKWFVYGLGIMVFGGLVKSIPYILPITLPAGIPSPLLSLASLALSFPIDAALPIALTIAVMRYRLYDIDTLINRTLVYGGLSLLIAALYVLVVGGLGTLFQVQGNLIIALLATGLVAVLFQPLRTRIQGSVNRLIFGERDDPMLALSNLGEKLETTVQPEEVLPTVVQTVAGTLKLPYVAISLRENDGMKIVAEHGKAVVEVISLPLVYQGERIGQMLVALRSPREPFSPDEMKLLSNVARQAGAAAHTVQLTADLQRSRERLVTAREEERRRLRRDLHDGLGASLAALHLQTGAIRRAIENDPELAKSMVAEFKSELHEAISDIRRVAYELRPPALDELGLTGALHALAVRFNSPSIHDKGNNPNQSTEEPDLDVQIEVPENLPQLPAAVEVAVYRIVQEALTNVVNHSEANSCQVSLHLDDAFHLEIFDDGIGISLDQPWGIGLSSMCERATELGGTCVIEPAEGGGTRVFASLPIRKEYSA